MAPTIATTADYRALRQLRAQASTGREGIHGARSHLNVYSDPVSSALIALTGAIQRNQMSTGASKAPATARKHPPSAKAAIRAPKYRDIYRNSVSSALIALTGAIRRNHVLSSASKAPVTAREGSQAAAYEGSYPARSHLGIYRDPASSALIVLSGATQRD